jgi:hypothetical protein
MNPLDIHLKFPDQATATAVLATATSDNVKVIEAWTIDAGANVYLRYIGEYN